MTTPTPAFDGETSNAFEWYAMDTKVQFSNCPGGQGLATTLPPPTTMTLFPPTTTTTTTTPTTTEPTIPPPKTDYPPMVQVYEDNEPMAEETNYDEFLEGDAGE